MEREFSVVLSELEDLQRWLLEAASILELTAAERHRLLLVAEELFVNLVSYGAAEQGSRVRVALLPEALRLGLEMVDSGGAFDPFIAGPPAPGALLGQGGLGLHLVRNLAEKTEYVRDAGRNRTLVWLARSAKQAV